MEGLGFRSARALGFGRGVEEHSAADALWIVLVVIDGDCCDCGVAERAGWIVSGVRRVLVVGADAEVGLHGVVHLSESYIKMGDAPQIKVGRADAESKAGPLEEYL